jgi:hypothetical protein
MIVKELLFAAFQRPLPYSAAKMKHSQMMAAMAPHS